MTLSEAALRRRLRRLKSKLGACEAQVADLRAELADRRAAPPKGIAVQGGFQNLPADDQRRELDYLAAAGCDWLRVGFNYDSPSPGIAVALRARERGIKVLAVLIAYGGFLPSAFEASVYGEKMAKLDAADAFEFWNEPNIDSFWRRPDPAAYATAYNACADGVHSVRPATTVVSGGLAPSPQIGLNIAPSEFLTRALDAGMKPDAIGWHPYCWPALPGGSESWSAWRQMVEHPAWGSYEWWATEFGAPSAGPGGVGESGQAQAIARGLELWASYTETGPLFVYSGRDDASIDPASREAHFGLLRADFVPKPSYGALQ